MGKINILFVCMGNICRSPSAHGVFQQMVDKVGLGDIITVDSAGTHAYHIGESPDRRSQKTASQRGYDLSPLRARRVESLDFEQYDYILAMDQENYLNLTSRCPIEYQAKLDMFMAFAEDFIENEVPDPYYGGDKGFERVLDMIENASQGLLSAIREKHQI